MSSFAPKARFRSGEPAVTPYKPVAAVSAGDVVVIAGQPAIAHGNIAAAQLASLAVGGCIYDIVTALDAAPADRTAIYWDATAQKATSVAGANTYLGWFVGNPAGAAAFTVLGDGVNRLGVFIPAALAPAAVFNGLTAAIADPGDGEALPVTASGHIDLVTAGAETRTLAAPAFAGQTLLLIGKTLVGACAVTVATGLDAQGSTVLTFSVAGSMALLVAKYSGANLRWSLAASDGLTKVLGAVTATSLGLSGPLTGGIGASTAAAGSDESDAGALPAGTAAVYPTTAADDTKGVIINAADKATGRMLLIGNGVANKTLKVYPPAGGTINGAAADAAFSSASGKGVIAVCLSADDNTWLMW